LNVCHLLNISIENLNIILAAISIFATDLVFESILKRQKIPAKILTFYFNNTIEINKY
jgi:hypothetical protein